MKYKTIKVIRWVVQLKGTQQIVSDQNTDYMWSNAKKFESYEGARAYCRAININPIDFEIVKAEFTRKILETREIIYSETNLGVAE